MTDEDDEFRDRSIYDGQDDSLLSERAKRLLDALPPRLADRWRDWWTRWALVEIEEWFDTMDATEHPSIIDRLRPPSPETSASVPGSVPVPGPADFVAAIEEETWERTARAVARIGDMFQKLTAPRPNGPGMKDEMALDVINQQLVRAAPAVAPHGLRVPLGLINLPNINGVPEIPGVTVDLPHIGPRVGWPPEPL